MPIEPDDADVHPQHCLWCGGYMPTFDVFLEDVQTVSSEGDYERYWTFLACGSCGGLLGVEVSHPDSEPMNLRRLLPAERDRYFKFRPDTGDGFEVDHLPPAVADPYNAARRVFRVKVFTSTTMELRRSIEAAAAHFGVTVKPLNRAIDKLVEEGLVTSIFAQVVHHVRALGNMGAHSGPGPTEEDALRAMTFTEAFLRMLFEMPEDVRRLGDPGSLVV